MIFSLPAVMHTVFFLPSVSYDQSTMRLHNNGCSITCRYRRKRENLVERTAISRLPTKWGLFQAYCYRSKLDGTEHIAVVKVNELRFAEEGIPV